MKPPYGVLAAINLDRGELVWQVPHGETPDAVRNHPALKGHEHSQDGQSASVGLVVTRSLVIVGDGQVTNPGGPAARRDAARLRQDHRRGSRRGVHSRARRADRR